MRRDVAQALEVVDHLVTLRAERIERGPAGRVAPHALAGNRHARIGGRRPHGADIEPRSVFPERRITEKFACEFTAGRFEFRPLPGAIPLGQQHDVDTMCGVAVICHLESLVAGRELRDEAGCGVDILAEPLFEAPPGIAAEDLDATRTPGIGEYDRFGIGTAHAVGLSRALPLVEERTEAARIDLPFGSAVDDAEKLVPVARRIEERHVRARPVGFGLQGVEEILFRAAVAAVVIVEAHRLFEEIVREAHLRRHGRARTEKQQ